MYVGGIIDGGQSIESETVPVTKRIPFNKEDEEIPEPPKVAWLLDPD